MRQLIATISLMFFINFSFKDRQRNVYGQGEKKIIRKRYEERLRRTARRRIARRRIARRRRTRKRRKSERVKEEK